MHIKPDITFGPCTTYLWEITDDSFFRLRLSHWFEKYLYFTISSVHEALLRLLVGVLQRTTPHIQCSYSTIQFIISIARQYCSTFYALLSVISKSSDYLSQQAITYYLLTLLLLQALLSQKNKNNVGLHLNIRNNFVRAINHSTFVLNSRGVKQFKTELQFSVQLSFIRKFSGQFKFSLLRKNWTLAPAQLTAWFFELSLKSIQKRGELGVFLVKTHKIL